MKIAIIAGSGNLPVQIARQNKKAFVLCIKDYSCPNSFQNKSEIVSLFDPISWLTVLKTNNITHIVMAGKIERPYNFDKITNEKANELINKIISVGDNSALNYIQDFFNKNGFEILPINSILKDCFMPKGFYQENLFSQNLKDFVYKSSQFGILYNHNKNLYDFGPVLIKIPKTGQNTNLDLPVIGLETVEKCKKLRFSSIVVSSKGTLIAELNKVMAYIKENNFCIYAI